MNYKLMETKAEEIYNRWQLQDKDLGNTEPYQFTKSELLDFAEAYHQEKMKEENKCKCRIPDLRMKVSENGISGYCTVCLKQS